LWALSAALVVFTSVTHAAPNAHSNEAARIRAIVNDPANADLFQVDPTVRLPKKENWNSAIGGGIRIFDESKLIRMKDYAALFSKRTQAQEWLTGGLHLKSNPPVSIVAVKVDDNPRRQSTYAVVGARVVQDAGNPMILFAPQKTAQRLGMGPPPLSSLPADVFAARGANWSDPLMDGSEDVTNLASKRAVLSAHDQILGESMSGDPRGKMAAGFHSILRAVRIEENGPAAVIVFLNTQPGRMGPRIRHGGLVMDAVPSVRDLFVPDDGVEKPLEERRAGYTTSFALAHLCMVTEAGRARWRDAYVNLLANDTGENITEASFRKFFGVGFAEMDASLAAHLEALRENDESWNRTIPMDASVVHFECRRATDAEIGCIKARMLAFGARATKNPSVAGGEAHSSRTINNITVTRVFPKKTENSQRVADDSIAQARLEILARFKRGTGDANLLTAIGDLECEFGDRERAMRYYKLADDAGADLSSRGFKFD
jgi:hypothetical protein